MEHLQYLQQSIKDTNYLAPRLEVYGSDLWDGRGKRKKWKKGGGKGTLTPALTNLSCLIHFPLLRYPIP